MIKRVTDRDIEAPGHDEPPKYLPQIAALLDALQCGALIVDRRGGMDHVNQRLCHMMQREAGELTGRTLMELYASGPGRDVIEHALSHFEEARQQEFYVPRADGTQLPVIVAGRLLKGASSAEDRRIITVIDISQQKRVEDLLQQNNRDMTTLSDTVLEQALELKRYSAKLEQRVKERTLELHRAHMEAIYMLAVASEAKDVDTGAHVRRIEHTTQLIARELGYSADESERIAYSAILHDVGKIQVPDGILRKPGALTDDEWKIMRDHTVVGERILSREPFFDIARAIARSHHENWDGSGYPDGLKGESIPMAARIVRVADVYDALTNARPYKAAWTHHQAVDSITSQEDVAFDPGVVRAFLRVGDGVKA